MKNRIIKFRAWDEKYKTMLADGFHLLGEVSAFSGIEIMLMENSKNNNDITPSLERLNDAVIMQFTSLKDKNGVDIYEGDIVKGGGDERKSEISEIEFANASFRVKSEFFGYCGEGLWDWDTIEVIGNIHQHAHLLT